MGCAWGPSSLSRWEEGGEHQQPALACPSARLQPPALPPSPPPPGPLCCHHPPSLPPPSLQSARATSKLQRFVEEWHEGQASGLVLGSRFFPSYESATHKLQRRLTDQPVEQAGQQAGQRAAGRGTTAPAAEPPPAPDAAVAAPAAAPVAAAAAPVKAAPAKAAPAAPVKAVPAAPATAAAKASEAAPAPPSKRAAAAPAAAALLASATAQTALAAAAAKHGSKQQQEQEQEEVVRRIEATAAAAAALASIVMHAAPPSQPRRPSPVAAAAAWTFGRAWAAVTAAGGALVVGVAASTWLLRSALAGLGRTARAAALAAYRTLPVSVRRLFWPSWPPEVSASGCGGAAAAARQRSRVPLDLLPSPAFCCPPSAPQYDGHASPSLKALLEADAEGAKAAAAAAGFDQAGAPRICMLASSTAADSPKRPPPKRPLTSLSRLPRSLHCAPPPRQATRRRRWPTCRRGRWSS